VLLRLAVITGDVAAFEAPAQRMAVALRLGTDRAESLGHVARAAVAVAVAVKIEVGQTPAEERWHLRADRVRSNGGS
jgi:hypothetical protein